MTRGIFGQARKSKGSSLTAKHLATLRSTSRRYPTATLLKTRVGFGVLLDGNRYLDLLISPGLTVADITAWLEAFVSLLQVDPSVIKLEALQADGQLFVVTVQRLSSR